jgi:pteridine reductase
MEEKPLGGRSALVTGAARRIGHAIAVALAAQGANITIHYRDSKGEAEELRRELEQYEVECRLIRADFTNRSEYEGLVDAAFEKAGRLDILVNNASIFPYQTLRDLTWEDLAACIQVNAWVPFYIGRKFAIRAGSGTVVNILDSRIGSLDLNHAAYLLSKQMLETLTRLMALEFAPGIRFNGVAPGVILPPPGRDNRSIEKLIPPLPLKRQGEASEIADAVLFLIRNEYVTGEVLYVDGGGHLAGT